MRQTIFALRSARQRFLLPWFAALGMLAIAAAASPRPQASPSETIPCRALEVHRISDRPLTLVIFHQRDAGERAALGEWLRAHSGASVEFQGSDGQWRKATALRLKSCFGRGVLLVDEAVKLAEKDEFLLRLSRVPANGH